MLEQTISVQDLPACPVSPLYTVTNLALLHVYAIRKEFGWDSRIFIKLSKNELLTNFLVANDLACYRRYGIYLDTDSTIGEEMQSLLVLPGESLHDEDTLRAFMGSAGSVDGFSGCIVEKDYSTIPKYEQLQDLQLLSTVIPGIRLHNVALQECFYSEQQVTPSSSTTKHLEGYEYVDVTSLFESTDCFSVSTEQNYRSVKELYKKLVSMYADKERLVLTYPTAHSTRFHYVYVYIAAFLTIKHHMHFEVSPHSQPLYLERLRAFTLQQNNYFHDYLHMLVNPISVGAFFNDGKGYICIRDTKRLFSNGRRNFRDYSIMMHVASVELDEKTLQLASIDYKVNIFDSERIEVLSIESLYDLDNSDFEKAKENMLFLDTVVAEFEDVLVKNSVLGGEDALNCSNVCVFKYAGVLRIGYVTNIVGKIPYLVCPISKGYKMFPKDFSFSEYNRIYDVAVFEESDVLLAQLKRQGILEEYNQHYNIPEHATGSLYTCLQAKLVRATEDCGFRIDEIGMWSVQTSQFRKGAEKIVLEAISNDVLRRKKFLTFYGGPHPAVLNTMDLEANEWK